MKFQSKTMVGLVLAGLLSTPIQAAETILFNCFFPPQHYVCKNFLPEMANRVKEATDGRVKVRIPPKSLTAPPDVFDGVKNGVMDGGIQFNAFLANQAPGMVFSLLPFVGSHSAESASVALYDTYQKHFGDNNEYGEAVLLSLLAFNGANLYSMNDTPIEKVSDIADRKMWALPGTTANVVKGTGSSVVSGPAVQMLEIIAKGVVDGYAGIADGDAMAFKLLDYTKSVTVMDEKIFQPTFSFFVSKKKWSKISDEDQSAIQSALGRDFSAYMGKFQDGIAAKAKAKFEEAGIKRVSGSDELLSDLKALGQGQIDGWVNKIAAMGVDGNQVIADYKAAISAAEAN